MNCIAHDQHHFTDRHHQVSKLCAGPLITWRTPVLGSYSGIEAVQIAANQNVGLAAADRVKVMQFMRPGHWRRIAHVFRECPQNLQRVTVFLEGKDGRYWAGRYGAKFSSPQLHFLQSDNLESYENGDGVPHYADAH